jgi:hypothetical protein
MRNRAGKDSVEAANAQAALGWNLVRQNKFPAAELMFREALAILEAKRPGVWPVFHNQSGLGAALAGQKKFAEAEPVLLKAYEGLAQREPLIPPFFKGHVTSAIERIVELFDAWGKKDKADEWRKKLEEAKVRIKPPSPP